MKMVHSSIDRENNIEFNLQDQIFLPYLLHCTCRHGEEALRSGINMRKLF
jgi:hypothetical protein